MQNVILKETKKVWAKPNIKSELSIKETLGNSGVGLDTSSKIS